jgi:hypothetical protein
MPESEAVALHAGRHVASFSSLSSESMLPMATRITREANRNGIIPLTFTA